MNNIVFFNRVYLRRAQQVIMEAEPFVNNTFAQGTAGRAVYDRAVEMLLRKIEAFLFVGMKKGVQRTADPELATSLRVFNDALTLMAETEGKPINQLLPSWAEWTRVETRLVQEGQHE